jgi:hypothetical protein
MMRNISIGEVICYELPHFKGQSQKIKNEKSVNFTIQSMEIGANTQVELSFNSNVFKLFMNNCNHVMRLKSISNNQKMIEIKITIILPRVNAREVSIIPGTVVFYTDSYFFGIPGTYIDYTEYYITPSKGPKYSLRIGPYTVVTLYRSTKHNPRELFAIYANGKSKVLDIYEGPQTKDIMTGLVVRKTEHKNTYDRYERFIMPTNINFFILILLCCLIILWIIKKI